MVGTEPTERHMFVKTDLIANNNKDYVYEIWDLGNGYFEVNGKFGRVGKTRQEWDTHKTLSRKQIDNLFYEREHKKGYKRVQLHVPTIAPTVTPTLATITPTVATHSKVLDVINLIFAEAGEYVKTYLAAAVESLSQQQIDYGKQLLKEAQNLYNDLQKSGHSITDDAMIRLVQNYYNTIPTILPARIDRFDITRQFVGQFDEQEDRLQQLEAQIATIHATNANPSLSNTQVLGANLSYLDTTSKEYQELSAFALSTHVHSNYSKIRIKDIFEVEIPVERKAFEANPTGKNHRELLFHGTNTRNVRHIMRTGLICPAVASSGRMFGNGVYFANKSSKSTQYCQRVSYSAPHMLFVAEVALGNMYIAPYADSSYRNPPTGFDSVWGKANVTGGSWSSSSGKLMYDEFIVYNTNQQSIRYLITFDK